ncbi:hypothetical protein F909_01621 [Acinetobacter sp. ANC 3929]|uniref:hypothetical protein n=1 Tax=unclassified Acinetobacter TaxID=196816 RepID=UPI0002CE73F4|nr:MULTISPECIES: hypothetical protein [unclassified Acinetobacter]ENW81932.1 hypothetical protein F909_01621 [Acinetobacter sp. ANC 3929]MCH7352915.1 hypothetical protein [Acinetobacter sp. NIPH 2023]MCH7356796.1 hypothetical protein [Acinetobacter sp. NIPH 1958]MCH7360238.1 hypothetical protein [Acinetobacter sp. NIPH 2024]
MNKKNFIFITLCLSGLVSPTHAVTPSDKTIMSWITNFQDSNASPPQAIQIDSTEAVKLISGEEAYLSGVSFENAGRNFWAGYVLTRPKLKQARILKEFGGQSNSFTVHSTVYKGKPIQLVEIESAGSGQGTVESSKSLVYLNQWTSKLIAEVEESSYEGRYDDKLGAEDCRTGRDNSGYLNVMPYAPYVVQTTVTGNACNNKPQGYKVSSKLIPIVITEIK